MGDLRDAFDLSVESNRKVSAGLDDALIEAGRKIAGRVDDAMSLGDGPEITKALYLLPHLMNILREMYATPKARDDAGIGKEAAGGRLAEVRQIRERPAPTKKRNAR